MNVKLEQLISATSVVIIRDDGTKDVSAFENLIRVNFPAHISFKLMQMYDSIRPHVNHYWSVYHTRKAFFENEFKIAEKQYQEAIVNPENAADIEKLTADHQAWTSKHDAKFADEMAEMRQQDVDIDFFKIHMSDFYYIDDRTGDEKCLRFNAFYLKHLSWMVENDIPKKDIKRITDRNQNKKQKKKQKANG